MPPALARILAFAAVLVLASAIAAACSVPGDTSRLDDPPSEPIDLDEARQLFQTTCRACHALTDAKAAGVFGPDLDLLQPEASTVRRAIDDGPGPMPNDLLSGEDADLVARYVAQVAGTRLEEEGEGGTRGNTKPR
jgi:mono/diheme cytochrome c family protein